MVIGVVTSTHEGATQGDPADLYCVEGGCTLEAVTTRPLTQTWLTNNGAIVDGREWVCSIHTGGGSTT